MVPCVVCSVFFCEYRLNLKWWFNINMFNAYPWVTLDYLCNFALRNLYSFQSLVNLILLDLYAGCLLLLIFRSCLFIKEWLYRWYVCGHYILDVFWNYSTLCWCRWTWCFEMIEVIRKTFLYSPLYQFFSEVDSSTFFRCGLITCDLGLKARCHGHCFRLVEVSDIFREDLDVI